MNLRRILAFFLILGIALPAVARKHHAGRHHRRHYHHRPHYCVTYEVMPGDTAWGVARMFGVPSTHIYYRGRPACYRVKRGKYKCSVKFRIGRTLKVCADYHLAPYYKEYYVVRKHDYPGKVARRLHVSLTRLERWNRYRFAHNRKGHLKLIPGKRMVYLKRGSAASSSIGAPFRGRLVNGVQLHSGPGYHVRCPAYAWGTNETIHSILNAIACFRAKHPDAPKVVIADISKRYGGKLKRHKSHRSGRDVDVGMFAVWGNSETDIPNHRPQDLNIPLTWDLIKCFVDTGKVKMIFLDYRMQRRFYFYLKKHPNLIPKGHTLNELIEYPKGKHSHTGLIRYEPGHRSHFHVRFVCPKGDGACRD